MGGRLVVLSGPSCVGKGPLFRAMELFYPELTENFKKLVLYNSRDPRPGEVEGIDYYFRSREQIEVLRSRAGFMVLDVRGDLQGLDVNKLKANLASGQDVFFEGNPFVPRAIWSLPEMAEVPMFRVFLAPLSRNEIIWFKKQGVNLPDMLCDIMRRKLLRRTSRQKGILSLKDLQNIEQRAESAAQELELAWNFDWVIPNHDGEDSENWNAFYYPVGDAYKAMSAFAAILSGETSVYAERWEEGLWTK